MKTSKTKNSVWGWVAAFLILSGMTGCSSTPPVVRPPDYESVGLASYYGRKFHGRKTANGERFNMHAMTAAHKGLPFGAMVKVTHLRNGRSVTVRINDRGPFVKGRIIDLSYAAAKRLRMISQGIARVRLRVER
jgi:rare lipoprotein A